MVYHGLSWFIMVYHGLSWFIMVYHGLSWFIMVYHGLSWFIINVPFKIAIWVGNFPIFGHSQLTSSNPSEGEIMPLPVLPRLAMFSMGSTTSLA